MANSKWATAGIIAAVLLCVWGSIEGYGVEAAYQEQNQDPYRVSAQFTRLSPLLPVVPEDAEMGYLTDAPAGSVVDSAMLNEASYVLAPRLIARGGGGVWVLGNFTRPGDFTAAGQRQGLRLERDFGNGVVLFRREQAR